jgi:CRP-like cAMP-binding protein
MKGYEYDSEKEKMNDFLSIDSKNYSASKKKLAEKQLSQSGNSDSNYAHHQSQNGADALSDNLGAESPGMFNMEAQKMHAKKSRSIGEIKTVQNLSNVNLPVRKPPPPNIPNTLVIPKVSSNLPQSQNSANNLPEISKKISILDRVPGIITNFFGSTRNSQKLETEILSQKIPSVKSMDFASPRQKFVRCVHAAIFVVKLRTILEQVKIFGTTSNLFNLTFRPPDNVYKSLKPPLADQEKIDPVKLHLKRWQINPMGYTTAVWNILMFFLIIYCVTFMPYGMVFHSENTDREMAEEIMNIFFGIDIFVNF